MWQGWINVVLGIWMIVSGLVPSLQTPVNLIIVGLLIAIMGFWTYKTWQGIVNGILGLWLFVSGAIIHLLAPVNFIIVGLVVALLALWEALGHPTEMRHKTA